MVNGEHDVYFHHNYLDRFIQDINEARSLIIIHVPFVGDFQMEQLSPHLVNARKRNVRVCVFLELPTRPQTAEEAAKFKRLCQWLRKMGVHVNFRPKCHEKLAIIDDRVAWEATLNMLSHYDTSERLNRWTCKDKIEEIKRSHNLDACEECKRVAGFCGASDCSNQAEAVRKELGREILRRRKRLKLTQSELAAMAGCRQADVSHAEAGCGSLVVDKFVSICLALGVGLRALPWYMLPRIDSEVELQHEINSRADSLDSVPKQKRPANSGESRRQL
ncbi:MAG: phospholipase D-like domain-containing protein [Candidatus Obscuribacterales bacterium]